MLTNSAPDKARYGYLRVWPSLNNKTNRKHTNTHTVQIKQSTRMPPPLYYVDTRPPLNSHTRALSPSSRIPTRAPPTFTKIPRHPESLRLFMGNERQFYNSPRDAATSWGMSGGRGREFFCFMLSSSP